MNSLKIPIVASSVILALGAIIAWKNHQQLTTAQVKQNQIITNLTNVGFYVDRSHPEKGACVTKRARENEEENIIHLNNPSHLADLIQKITIALKHDLQLVPKNEDPTNELKENFNNLDFEDWRILFTELRTNQDFEITGDNNFILNEIISTLYQHTDSTTENSLLKLASEFPEFFKDNSLGRTFISNQLTGLLENDSDAAIEWLQQIHLKFPGFVQDLGFACGFISDLAIINPTRSLELISELAIKNVDYAISVSASDMQTNAQRTSFLNALLKYDFVINKDESRDQMINSYKISLARSALEQGFDIGTQWLSVVENQPIDWNRLIDCIGEHNKTTNFEKWAEWIEKNLPAKSIDTGIHTLVSNWTKEDYREAGEWLVKTSEGPTKHAAIRAYAKTIAAYEPATAAQWADKLPPGESRDRTLNIIYSKWPKTDLAGKDAFGKLHHLE